LEKRLAFQQIVDYDVIIALLLYSCYAFVIPPFPQNSILARFLFSSSSSALFLSPARQHFTLFGIQGERTAIQGKQFSMGGGSKDNGTQYTSTHVPFLFTCTYDFVYLCP
jgi:hypothetical protein